MTVPVPVHVDRPTDRSDAAALEALMTGAFRLLSLSHDATTGGATRFAFPHHNADAAIAKTIGEFDRACYEVRRLVLARALGEPTTLYPSATTLKIELQRCVERNDANANIHPLGPVLTAAARVDAAERSLILAAHRVGDTAPPLSDLQSGFHHSLVR